MADYYVKSTGTKLSGASAADDWSDANCYNDIGTALQMVSADGDNVIIDDGTYVKYGFVMSTNTNSFTGTITLKARNFDSSLVKIDAGVGAGRFISFNKTNVTVNVENITFQNYSSTLAGNPPLDISGMAAGSNPTWTNVVVDNCDRTVAGAINNNSLIWLHTITGTVIFDNLEIKNCNLSMTGSTIGPLVTSANTIDVTLTDCYFHDNLYSHTDSTTIATMYFRGDLTLTGDNVFENESIDASGQIYSGYIRCVGNVTANTGNTTIDGISLAGQGSTLNGWIARFEGVSVVSNLIVRNCTQTGFASNDIGGVCAYGTSAQLSISDSQLYNNTGCFEGVLSASQGGRLNAERVQIYENEVKVGAMRFGGWNTGHTAKFCVIKDNNAQDNGVYGGGGMQLHIHGDATTSQEVLLYHNTVINNTSDTGTDCAVTVANAGGGGNSLVVTMSNNLFYNPNTDYEIYDLEVGGTVTIISDYDLIYGGQVNTNGIDTYGVNNISADPLLTTSGRLTSTSPAIDEGTWISGVNDQGYADPWGKYVHRLPNIGADQGAGTPIRRYMLLIGR